MNPFRLFKAIRDINRLSQDKKLSEMSGWETFLWVLAPTLGMLIVVAMVLYVLRDNSGMTVRKWEIGAGVVATIFIGAIFLFARKKKSGGDSQDPD